MKVFIDALVFLKLLLDEPGAERAQEILESVEKSLVAGYITPMTLEEVAFELLYAKASKALNTRNVWRIRETLKSNEGVSRECMSVLRRIHSYIEYMLTRGLRVEQATYSDWKKALEIMDRYGLLPADAVHVAALRIGVEAIATFGKRQVEVAGKNNVTTLS